MDFLKINFFVYLSSWLRLLLIVYVVIESNPGPDSVRRVRVLYSNIRILHATLEELTVAGSSYDVLVCAGSRVFNRRYLSYSSVSLVSVAPNKGR